MKIAIFTDLYLEVAGGIPSSVKAQKAELERLGHKVTVFCPGFSCDEKRVVLVPTAKHLKPGGAPLARWPGETLKWLRKEWAEFDFDVVHVHYEAGASIAGILYAREKGVPVVQTMHGREDMAIAVNVPHPFKTLVGWLFNFIHGRYLKHEVKVRVDDYLAPTVARAKMWTLMVGQANAADVVLTPSKHFRDKLKHYGVSREILVVSNGVPDKAVEGEWPVRRFGAGEGGRGDFSEELDGSGGLEAGEKLKMIWASRVSREKRIIPFLVALAMLPRKDWEMEVFGGGNELAKAKRLSRKLGISERVFFRGGVTHEKLLSRMREAQLSIMASYGFDTQGLTLLEAEAVGMPVFYCDPDMKEVVPRSGAIAAKGPEPEEMARALATAFRPGKIEEMSKVMLARRKEVLQSEQVKKLLKIYSGLVK